VLTLQSGESGQAFERLIFSASSGREMEGDDWRVGQPCSTERVIIGGCCFFGRASYALRGEVWPIEVAPWRSLDAAALAEPGDAVRWRGSGLRHNTGEA
jgi:hypothetical protein